MFELQTFLNLTLGFVRFQIFLGQWLRMQGQQSSQDLCIHLSYKSYQLKTRIINLEGYSINFIHRTLQIHLGFHSVDDFSLFSASQNSKVKVVERMNPQSKIPKIQDLGARGF